MTTGQFLTPQQEQRIIKAIQTAEKNTSGEIRVHLESKNKEKPSMPYVESVFDRIGMTQTKDRNGVLFYVDIKHKVFTVLGDKGIDAKVPPDFWQDVKKEVLKHFKTGDYTLGLERGILMVGKKLKNFFPYQNDDVNELPDEISKN